MAFRRFMDRLMSKADNLFLIFSHKKKDHLNVRVKMKGLNNGSVIKH